MFFLLFGFWILLNGKWTAEIAIVGAVLSALIYAFMCAFMDCSPSKEWRLIRRAPKLAGYVCFMIAEIFRSAFTVMRFIWTPRDVIEPQLVSFDSKLKTDSARVLLADSITLTPGTVTVTMRGGKFLVHAIDSSMAEGIDSNEMLRRVADLEGGDRL